MKVLSIGGKRPMKQFSCAYCGSLVAFYPFECQWVNDVQYPARYGIRCPVCGYKGDYEEDNGVTDIEP